MANSRTADPPNYIPIDKIFRIGDNEFTDMGLSVKKDNILHSWKEISAYLERDVRTCHRWEDELGLPIHRIDENSPRSKVFAYKSEIDEWLREKANNHDEKALSARKIQRVFVGFAAVFLLSLIFFGWLYFSKSTRIPSLSEPSLAVIPLKNLNSSEYEEYFSEGITNEIERSLIRLNKIRVIPGSFEATSPYSAPNMGTIGNEVRPDYLVMGELRLDEDKIWLSINLIRTEDNKNLWNASYESDQEDILNVSQRISHKIHEQLNVQVDDALFTQAKSESTADFSAYDAFLKGNFILNRIAEQDDDPWKLYHQGKYFAGRWTPESNEMAISLFNQALELDPTYVRAYIGLARCYANYVNFSWDSGVEWLETAESLLEKAQKIAPDLPEYYTALIGIHLLRDVALNENMNPVVFSLAKEAIAKYPNHPQLNTMIAYCFLTKFGEKGNEEDFAKALDYNERSFLLNPSSLKNIKYAEILMLKKEFYKALDICHMLERSDPSLYSRFVMGQIYYYMGDLARSEEIFRQFDVPLNFKIHSLYYLAMIAAQKGETEKALRLVRDVELLKPEEYRDLSFHLEMASVYFGMGDEESGYHYLGSLFGDSQIQKDRYVNAKFVEIDGNFDRYRNEKKFQNLIQGEK
jgi:TolB-like protein